jgi:hypothetical protein
VGTWHHVQVDTYTSTFELFRFNPDGTFASTARVTRTIELSEDGTQFTSAGTVEDFDAQDRQGVDRLRHRERCTGQVEITA